MPLDQPHILTIRSIAEAPGAGGALDAAFAHAWPAYERWMSRSEVSDSSDCVRQLRSHMPELMLIFESLLHRFGGSDAVARFLTLYAPPRVVRACSQLVLDTDDGPVLLRTYDHAPHLFDGLVLHSRWGGKRGAKTLAVTDCLWGALDGVNDRGLAVTLAFGGRNAIGPGFSAPLIVRYLLETCGSVAEARKALDRLPVYMPYTFVVVDAEGTFVTAFLGPDRPAHFVTRRASANHQGENEWPEYAAQTQSFERLACAEKLIKASTDLDRARRAFLSSPLWRSDYAKASGTLYIAETSPAKGTLTLRWPDRFEGFRLDAPSERTITVELPTAPQVM